MNIPRIKWSCSRCGGEGFVLNRDVSHAFHFPEDFHHQDPDKCREVLAANARSAAAARLPKPEAAPA